MNEAKQPATVAVSGKKARRSWRGPCLIYYSTSLRRGFSLTGGLSSHHATVTSHEQVNGVRGTLGTSHSVHFRLEQVFQITSENSDHNSWIRSAEIHLEKPKFVSWAETPVRIGNETKPNIHEIWHTMPRSNIGDIIGMFDIHFLLLLLVHIFQSWPRWDTLGIWQRNRIPFQCDHHSFGRPPLDPLLWLGDLEGQNPQWGSDQEFVGSAPTASKYMRFFTGEIR